MNKKSKNKSIHFLFAIMMLAMMIGLAGCDMIKRDKTIDNHNIDSNPNTTSLPKEDASTIPDKDTTEPEQETPTTDDNQPIYYGDWIISKVQASGVGTYSEDDINSLIGKTLSYSADKASYFGDDISYVGKVTTNPTYTETLYTESEFLDFYRIPIDLLGLDTDVITEISVTDADGHVSTLILKDKDTMLVLGGGTYFELTRSVTE